MTEPEGDARLDRLDRDIASLGGKIGRSLAEEARLRDRARHESQRAARTSSPATARRHLAASQRYAKAADATLKDRASWEKRRMKMQAERDTIAARVRTMMQRRHEESERALAAQLARTRTALAQRELLDTQRSASMPDLFICHASEDKDEVARPLAEHLVGLGARVWYDEYALRVGDSISGRIDEGLRTCRFGVVVLSPQFFCKRWPQRELAGLVARMTHEDRDLLLPVWHNVSVDEVLAFSAPLVDVYALRTAELTMRQVAESLLEVTRTDR
jgi:hypothetical protein